MVVERGIFQKKPESLMRRYPEVKVARVVIAITLVLLLAEQGLSSTVCEKGYGYRHEMAKDAGSDREYVICEEPPRPPLVPELKPPPIAMHFGSEPAYAPTHSCPETAPEKSAQSTRPAEYRLEKTVRFRFASSKVEDIQALDQAARALKEDPHVSGVRVKGFTCDLGPKAYNDRLAMRRAVTVAAILGKAGVKIDEVTGEGKCCYLPGGRSISRRAEILVQRSASEEEKNEKQAR
jgi:outer membrane protein OmpA-like peptidoglycan-associated protein